ncbi:MAG: hypothetical protein H0T89_00070 [Deltaproteobacteria bacterium]|nr:hypothetical protein [Deltaproteobacteria bacterium]MDQ3295308.1 hypothetical protein [Myxococcota bacterium]
MRNLLTITTGLLLVTAACDGAPGAIPEPPILKITSPQRSLIQNGAGQIMVTGTVTPNADGDAISKVLVNNVAANVNADGSFQATIQVQPGATLIHTVATAVNGVEAKDTRAIHAGDLRPNGTTIDRAVTAAISTEAFAKIAAAAGPMIEAMDVGPMLAPMNPMIHAGDESGEDCLFGRVFIDDVNFSNIAITLTPKVGGLAFRAQIDGLDVPGRARYAVACANGSNTIRIKATKVVVGGTLTVAPDGMKGFKTDLLNPVVTVTGLDIQASGIPGTIIDLLRIDQGIQYVIGKFAPLAMKPMMNQALGGLAGPQTLDLLGRKVDLQVAPAEVKFDANGGVVVMNMKMLIQGTEAAKGFIYTDNGTPVLDPGDGFQIGLADDLANQMMGQAGAIGLLNLEVPASGGTFDNSSLAMSLPPMISADPTDGRMKVILGDMIITFTSHGTPVGKAAINAKIDLKIESANNGYGVAIQLGTPEIFVTVLDDIDNATLLQDADLSRAVEICLQAQISSISKLLTGIPLPSVAGLQMRNVSVGADDGYVMVNGAFE